MGTLGLLVTGIGLVLFVWVISAPIRRKNKSLGIEGTVAEGEIVNLKEWLHEGHRRCQVEYTYTVPDPETGKLKTLKGKSNCVPIIFDRLEIDSPIKIRYLPQKPEFSRPLFDD